MNDVCRAIARLATRQDGVISRRQLRDIGLSRHDIDYRLATRNLLPLHRGVFALGHEAVSDRGRGIAALLAVGPPAAITRATAAVLYRFLDAPFPDRPDVVVIGRQLRKRDDLNLHTTRMLHPLDLRKLDGLPVTSPARTLLDQAGDGLAQPDLDRQVAEARVKRIVTARDLEEILARATGHRGIAALRAALRGPGGAPTRSRLERLTLNIIIDAGLPRPMTNARIGRYEPDFLWPAEKVIVETDGWDAHGHWRAFEHDRERDAWLQARGYVVLRFTWRQIIEQPTLVATRIAQVLAVRAAA